MHESLAHLGARTRHNRLSVAGRSSVPHGLSLAPVLLPTHARGSFHSLARPPSSYVSGAWSTDRSIDRLGAHEMHVRGLPHPTTHTPTQVLLSNFFPASERERRPILLQSVEAAAAAAAMGSPVTTWAQDPLVKAFESSSISRAPPGVRSVRRSTGASYFSFWLLPVGPQPTSMPTPTAHSFGTAPRASLVSLHAADVPGPGQYALPSHLIKKSGGFSLRGRVRFGSVYGGGAESRAKDTRPGPVRAYLGGCVGGGAGPSLSSTDIRFTMYYRATTRASAASPPRAAPTRPRTPSPRRARGGTRSGCSRGPGTTWRARPSRRSPCPPSPTPLPRASVGGASPRTVVLVVVLVLSPRPPPRLPPPCPCSRRARGSTRPRASPPAARGRWSRGSAARADFGSGRRPRTPSPRPPASAASARPRATSSTSCPAPSACRAKEPPTARRQPSA